MPWFGFMSPGRGVWGSGFRRSGIEGLSTRLIPVWGRGPLRIPRMHPDGMVHPDFVSLHRMAFLSIFTFVCILTSRHQQIKHCTKVSGKNSCELHWHSQPLTGSRMERLENSAFIILRYVVIRHLHDVLPHECSKMCWELKVLHRRQLISLLILPPNFSGFVIKKTWDKILSDEAMKPSLLILQTSNPELKAMTLCGLDLVGTGIASFLSARYRTLHLGTILRSPF